MNAQQAALKHNKKQIPDGQSSKAQKHFAPILPQTVHYLDWNRHQCPTDAKGNTNNKILDSRVFMDALGDLGIVVVWFVTIGDQGRSPWLGKLQLTNIWLWKFTYPPLNGSLLFYPMVIHQQTLKDKMKTHSMCCVDMCVHTQVHGYRHILCLLVF